MSSGLDKFIIVVFADWIARLTPRVQVFIKTAESSDSGVIHPV